MRISGFLAIPLITGAAVAVPFQAAVVPNEVQMPGTQPLQVTAIDGDSLSENTQSRVDFCLNFEAERRRSVLFSKKLIELDLITLQSLTPGGDPDAEPLAKYYAVDSSRLNALSPSVLGDLNKEGFLSFIFAHLFSLENWNRLLQRRNLMAASQ